MQREPAYRRRNYIRSPEEEALVEELYIYSRSGCRICLNGRPSRPERVADACLRENRTYMRDFVGDADENICEIDFVRIKNR